MVTVTIAHLLSETQMHSFINALGGPKGPEALEGPGDQITEHDPPQCHPNLGLTLGLSPRPPVAPSCVS